MPLIDSPSKEAREKNIETEIHANKPIKQAVAIGYSMQRHAEHKDGHHEHKIGRKHHGER
jgi:hypothetical protein